ncbi:hypothetical protein CC78DRAFT_9878 [Lojkania enalia]|uniref:Uncharacterized protein n=1 Tax=Lojkania enalia TaxID=147567 RepID=A0A9P4NDE0_9PLEO|nr:hypothetical protein CC78DRAFT_9878 [Didymosphaeria enalia]
MLVPSARRRGREIIALVTTAAEHSALANLITVARRSAWGRLITAYLLPAFWYTQYRGSTAARPPSTAPARCPEPECSPTPFSATWIVTTASRSGGSSPDPAFRFVRQSVCSSTTTSPHRILFHVHSAAVATGRRILTSFPQVSSHPFLQRPLQLHHVAVDIITD